MQEMQVWSLGGEDALEKEMGTHSSILAWEIPWTEELGGLLSMGSQRVGYSLVTKQQQLLASRALSNTSSTMKKIKRKEHYKLAWRWWRKVFRHLQDRWAIRSLDNLHTYSFPLRGHRANHVWWTPRCGWCPRTFPIFGTLLQLPHQCGIYEIQGKVRKLTLRGIKRPGQEEKPKLDLRGFIEPGLCIRHSFTYVVWE